MSPKTRLWIIISLTITGLAVLVFLLFFYNARLTIRPTPSSAQALIDGQPVAVGVALKLKPGSYQLQIRADGFLPHQETIKLAISQIKDLPIELKPIPKVSRYTDDAQFAVLTPEEDALLYLGNKGKQFFRAEIELSADGKPIIQAISAERFKDLTNVVWSPDRNLAVLQTKTGETKLFDFKRYDFLTQEETNLGNDLGAVTWSPDSRELIAFVRSDSGERSLIRRTIADGKVERLIDLRGQFDNPQIAWSPDSRSVLLVENKVAILTVNTRTIANLAGTDGAKAASWSPKSDKILAEFANNLAVVTVAGGSSQTLPIRTSLNKAAWLADNERLIVATSTDRGQDQLEKVTVASAERQPYLYQADGPVSVSDILINKSSQQTWFVSNGQLLGLELAKAS